MPLLTLLATTDRSLADADEGVTERGELSGHVGLLPTLAVAPLALLAGAAAVVAAPIGVTPVEDDDHVGLLGKLSSEVGVQIRLLPGHDK